MEQVYLIASGDLRLAANQNCEAAQSAMEAKLKAAFLKEGVELIRAHPYDSIKGHGFIDSQKYGMEVFRSGIPKDAPLLVAEAVWQYSHHILAGLATHRGPILTVANWSGQWPGIVGLLNLNASLTKMGVPYSTLWSEDFADEFFTNGLKRWITNKRLLHDTSHVRKYEDVEIPKAIETTGREFAERFRTRKAIMGVFDEGCMGMYNAIIPDDLLQRTGVWKERLSQSSLYASMLRVRDTEAETCFEWLVNKGMSFRFGASDTHELTKSQVLQQLKMYIAAVRTADEFGCDTIGIQYQQGLKDLTPASDLVEGLLNNCDRPPVFSETARTNHAKELYANADDRTSEALPHFNEVDECAGLDALITYRLWRELHLPPETTLHDLRWGRVARFKNREEFVWVLMISGAVPPAHLIGGYHGATSERQPPMYFRLGGGTIKGISKPGWVVWSRIFVTPHGLNYDTGIGEVVELSDEETQDRWQQTTPQWPIMHLVTPGVSRDQMMARHKANHIQVAYASDRRTATNAMLTKAAAMRELGLMTSICGESDAT